MDDEAEGSIVDVEDAEGRAFAEAEGAGFVVVLTVEAGSVVDDVTAVTFSACVG